MRSRAELETELVEWIEMLISGDSPYTTEYIRGRIGSIRWALND